MDKDNPGEGRMCLEKLRGDRGPETVGLGGDSGVCGEAEVRRFPFSARTIHSVEALNTRVPDTIKSLSSVGHSPNGRDEGRA